MFFSLQLIMVLLSFKHLTALKVQYAYTTKILNYSSQYNWEEVQLTNDVGIYSNYSYSSGVRLATEIVDIPVYVSLTSVSFRIDTISDTLRTIYSGIVIPNHVFLFISKNPYLLDEGIQTIPQDLLAMVASNMLTIVYTDNIGPHRKLLPILSRFYNDDIIIVNVDDDMVYKNHSSLLYQLLRTYRSSPGDAVIALRARRIGICNHNQWETTRYATWSLQYTVERREMLLLPTGTGGILYRPKFFHPIVFDSKFRNVTGTADDIMFRLSCMAKNVPVLIACRDLEHNGNIMRQCPIEKEFDSFTAIISDSSNSEVNRVGFNETTVYDDKVNITNKVGTAINYEIALPNAKTTLANFFIGVGSSQGNIGNMRGKRSVALMQASDQLQQRRNLRTSLYSINKYGRNDYQWHIAVWYLKQRQVLDFPKLLALYAREREPECYANNTTSNNSNITTLCSVLACNIVAKDGNADIKKSALA